MSRRTKLCITALFLVLLAIPVGYVAITWSVPGDALVFRCTGVVPLPEPVNASEFTKPRAVALVEIEFNVENAHAIPIHIEQAHLLPKEPAVSSPVDPTLLVLTLASRSNTYLGPLHPEQSNPVPHMSLGIPFPEPPPVPAHGVQRYSVVMTKEAAATFDPAKAHVLYTWRTATQHRVDKCIWWCRSLLPEKYRDHLRGPGYTMDITPIVIPPPDPFDTDSP